MMNTISRFMACAALTLLLQACASAPAAISYYDFGAAPDSAKPLCALPPINLADISSTDALDSNLMLYRLLYANDLETRAFGVHRWNATPAQLLTSRIKLYLATNQVSIIDAGVANPQGWQLRLDLIDFSQYFTDPGHSYARLQTRASVLRGNQLIAQTTLTQRAPAAEPNARAGANAMRAAGDALVIDLSNWLCKQKLP